MTQNAQSIVAEITQSRLASFTHQAGGANKVMGLPLSTFFEMTAHPDESLPISLDRWVIEINDLDLDTGYEVFSDQHELLYAVTEPEDRYWGLAEGDAVVAYGLSPGAYVYLVYTPVGAAEPRTLLLVKI